uniref:Uncharacterized protein n=1 Tax=uncultured marine Nitrospinaceae bacterium TaxID=482920 RepID=A4GJ56_9BACT|nr:hypothetical protein [uncultured marine Nitrospinaceae bacterium]
MTKFMIQTCLNFVKNDHPTLFSNEIYFPQLGTKVFLKNLVTIFFKKKAIGADTPSRPNCNRFRATKYLHSEWSQLAIALSREQELSRLNQIFDHCSGRLMSSVPVFSPSYIHNQGNFKGHHLFHFFCNQSSHFLFLILRTFEHQFIMNLQDHPGF